MTTKKIAPLGATKDTFAGVKVKKVATPRKPKPVLSNVYRLLSSSFIVNAEAFANASVAEKNATMLANTTNQPIQFITNFVDLTNGTMIRDKLLAGGDVSLELEFNGVKLTDAEQAALTAVAPVLAKLMAIKPSYPWKPARKYPNTRMGETSIDRGGYEIDVAVAKKIWQKASKRWGSEVNNKKKTSGTANFSEYISGRTRYIYIYADRVAIGCQSVMRSEVEAIARHYKWSPSI